MVYACNQNSRLQLNVFWTNQASRSFMTVEKKYVIYIIFHAEIFNSEISELFAVGNEISVKIKTYGIYCPYRYNNHLRDEAMR